jgi:ankyrin repeat protein
MLASDPNLIRARDANDQSPIMVAAYYQQHEIANTLVDQSVTITVFEAAATGKVQQLMLMLAKDPSLVNAYADDGFQPLGLSALFGHTDAVDFLLRAGAWVNGASRNKLQATPLNSAAARGYVDVAYHLLEAGADPNVKQNGDISPLHSAAFNGQVDMIRVLLEHGANQQVRNKDGKTPLEVATETGHHPAAMLLKSGITRRFRKPTST